MTFGIQKDHHDLGQEFTYETEGKPSFSGVCDRVEIQPAIFRNAATGEKTADKKIRLRLKTAERARWSGWMPLYETPETKS